MGTRPLEDIRKQRKQATKVERQTMLQREEAQLVRFDSGYDEVFSDWKRDWSEYQTQVWLLRLDVDEASANLEVSKKVCELSIEMVRQGAEDKATHNQKKLKAEVESIRLSRAIELHRLYAEIEKTSPELNPHLFVLIDQKTKP